MRLLVDSRRVLFHQGLSFNVDTLLAHLYLAEHMRAGTEDPTDLTIHRGEKGEKLVLFGVPIRQICMFVSRFCWVSEDY